MRTSLFGPPTAVAFSSSATTITARDSTRRMLTERVWNAWLLSLSFLIHIYRPMDCAFVSPGPFPYTHCGRSGQKEAIPTLFLEATKMCGEEGGVLTANTTSLPPGMVIGRACGLSPRRTTGGKS